MDTGDPEVSAGAISLLPSGQPSGLPGPSVDMGPMHQA